jgi:D-tyrosyl-tRNA(Tyr) deacylase
MRLVVQRVDGAAALRDNSEVARIDRGLVVFAGFGPDDGRQTVARMAAKVAHLRIFEAGDSFFGRSVIDAGGEVLTVSQFTLYADCSRGRRPDLSHAAPPELAEKLYLDLGQRLLGEGVHNVAQGPFKSRLHVRLDNWGPFTVVLDSDQLWPGGEGR